MQAHLITEPQAMAAALDTLQASKLIALDTEFMRERTYYGQLCLIQIGDGQRSYAIDPLAIEDLGALGAFLGDRSRLKILHAGDQDLELMAARGAGPFGPIYDTQLAAMLAGFGEQIGYARLVESVCKVQLAKGQTRTDWARRPLHEGQIDYALDDVRYLPEIYSQLQGRLEQSGRAEWLASDFEALEVGATTEADPRGIWRRVKGHGKLRPAQLAVLRELAAWREQRARERDKPRGWLVKDEVLVELARLQPEAVEDMLRLRGVDERFAQRHGDTVLALIADGKAVPAEDRPRLPPKPDPALEPMVDVLMAITRDAAARHQVALSMLANRDALRKLAAGDHDLRLLRGWRKQLVGEQLLAFVEGNNVVQVRDGALQVL